MYVTRGRQKVEGHGMGRESKSHLAMIGRKVASNKRIEHGSLDDLDGPSDVYAFKCNPCSCNIE